MIARLAWLGTYIQTRHDDRDDVVGQGEIDLVHDQDLVVTEARLGFDVGVTRRIAASLVLPVRVVSAAIRYLDGSGDEVELTTPGIHHRNEVVSGLGDPMVLGAFAHTAGGLRLVARAGTTVPLGRTEDNPFTAEAMITAHQHVQMGSGTFNPVLALEASRAWGAWRLGGFVFTQQVLYENGKGYQAGDRYAAGLVLRRRVGRSWNVRGGAEMQAETAEHWDGIVHTDDGNRGRIDAMLAAGASWSATPNLTLDLALKVPFVTHAVGGQLDMPAIVELGVSWSFGARAARPASEDEHDHEHDHEHGDEHGHDEHGDEHGHDEHGGSATTDQPAVATARADVADLGKGGAAPALVPVRGKLTIFDFWAPWCQPCKTLEPALIALANKYPDLVAIRRIDIVDWDSPATQRYLSPKAFDLPHLKIYDAAGRLVLEKSSAQGKLQALIDEVRALVEKAALARPAPNAAPTTPATPVPAPNAAPTTPAAPVPAPNATPTKPAAPAPSPKPALPKPTAPAPAKRAAASRFRIEVTDRGFEPANVVVPRGRPVTLVFERTTSRGCGTEVVFEVAGKKIEAALPTGQPVEIAVTFPTAGVVRYACAMDMIRGTFTVK